MFRLSLPYSLSFVLLPLMEESINKDCGRENSKIGDENDYKHKEMETEEEEENFNLDFQCCICLDLLYKPVILVCGHLSCFWCVYKAMNFWHESHCPICRNPYNHFPNVCQLLHLLLLKIYPVAYKRRQKQVEEEEKNADHFSPEVNGQLFVSHPSEELEPATHSTERESSSCENSEKLVLHGDDNGKSMPSTSSESCGTTTSATDKCSLSGSELESKINKQVSVADLICVQCKKLLCRPVVLNCGHVYCESCIIVPAEGIPRCPICQSLLPNGMPSVCYVLEHFLQEQFPHEYTKRLECLPKDSIVFNHSKRTGQLDKQSSTFPSHFDSSWLFGNGPKVHIGCGCDSCGMTPIVGKRYKCKDCVERIGFDLCEGCYINSSKLLGRFNQQHKPDHNFEIVPLPTFNELLAWLNSQFSDEDDTDAPEDQEDRSANPIMLANVPMDVHDGSNDMGDVSSSLVLSADVAPDEEDGSSEPNLSGMKGED